MKVDHVTLTLARSSKIGPWELRRAVSSDHQFGGKKDASLGHSSLHG